MRLSFFLIALWFAVDAAGDVSTGESIMDTGHSYTCKVGETYPHRAIRDLVPLPGLVFAARAQNKHWPYDEKAGQWTDDIPSLSIMDGGIVQFERSGMVVQVLSSYTAWTSLDAALAAPRRYFRTFGLTSRTFELTVAVRGDLSHSKDRFTITDSFFFIDVVRVEGSITLNGDFMKYRLFDCEIIEHKKNLPRRPSRWTPTK